MLGAWGSGGRNTRRYLDAILGNLRSAGFSTEKAVHAFWVLDSYVYGHVIQEVSIPLTSTEDLEPNNGSENPALAEIEVQARGSEFTFDDEFEYGPELILEALDGIQESAAIREPPTSE